MASVDSRAVSEAENTDTRPAAGPDLSALCLLAGVASLGWGVAIYLPAVPDAPAWPAATLGVAALVLARLPGRPLPRGLGSFMGVLGFLAALAQLLALWGLLELLD